MENIFKQGLKVENTNSTDKTNFEKIYSELLNFLKTVNFEKLAQNDKINLQNYKSDSKDENVSELTDEEIKEIIDRIKILTSPKYLKYLKGKEIPNRSNKPNFENLPADEKAIAEANYKKKLADEEKTIKCMYYIKELGDKFLFYYDKETREYFINLCTNILLQYSESHPEEVAKIHFRFKSPKGLAIKCGKNIMLNSHFERNPQTGKDTLQYKEINDAFGAKIVSQKGYDPVASYDKEIQELIESRDARKQKLAKYQLFKEKIEKFLSEKDETSEDKDELITYREYYDNCIGILEQEKAIINKEETDLLQSIQDEITHIQGLEDSLDTTSSLDDPIINLDLFEDPQVNFKNFFTEYTAKIPSELTVAGLKKGLNKIFNNTGKTNNDILNSNILKAFRISVYKVEEKHSPSGHEGIHYDIQTPFGKFELQAQNEEQYISDQKGITNAHALMDGKEVPIYKVPNAYKSITENEKDEFIKVETNSGNVQYYKKTEIDDFIKKIEYLTAKKGIIGYNNGLGNAQIELYSSLYNYASLAMEIPDNDPHKKSILTYFTNLENKHSNIRKVLFHHVDSITRHMNMSQIKDYIFNLRNMPQSTNPSQELR